MILCDFVVQINISLNPVIGLCGREEGRVGGQRQCGATELGAAQGRQQ